MDHPGISNKGISSDTSEELRTIKKSLSRCQTRLEVRDYIDSEVALTQDQQLTRSNQITSEILHRQSYRVHAA